MNNKILIDRRLKRKIKNISELLGVYTVEFKDLTDVFWFDTSEQLQEFLNNQSSERYYDKELRKGYFDYINENNDTLRYHIKSNRGTLEVIKEENLGIINC